MKVLETFIGADGLEFKIVEYDRTIINDVKDFCENCKQEGFKNNESISALKMGRWGTEEKWWAVYHNGYIVSLSGAHWLPHIHNKSYVIAYRLATLDEFKGLASKIVSSRMLTCFGMGRLLPHMVDWCESRGATDIVMTFNSPDNGDDPSGTMHKAHRAAHNILPRDNKFSLMYQDFPLYGAKQDVWKLNYRNLITMEKI